MIFIAHRKNNEPSEMTSCRPLDIEVNAAAPASQQSRENTCACTHANTKITPSPLKKKRMLAGTG
jgi:hypothetical protein